MKQGKIMGEKKKIMAIGANPAWQKVLQFGQLRCNAVNRADAMWSFASGKGINFSRAAQVWNWATVDLVQFAGGDNGKLLLDDLANEKLPCKTFLTNIPTRCCTTLLSLSDGTMTELIEPSQAPGWEAECDALEFIKENMPKVDGVALCGQLPSGMSPDFYVQCVKYAAENNKLVLIDSWKNIASVLQASREAMLKINAEELTDLTGIDDVVPAMKMLFASYSLKYIAITDGAKSAWLGTREAIYKYNVPEIEKVVNPVGSGDTASAVCLSCLLAGESPERAFAYAIAAASANCLSMKCGDYDRAKAIELFDKIKIETI